MFAILGGRSTVQMSSVSFRPSLAVDSGLFGDADATILECGFTMWDYNGTQKPGPALQINFQDIEGKTHAQYFSAGDAAYWVASDDNSTLVPVGDKRTLNSNTNFMRFMASLVNAGFPEDQLDGSITVLNGLECHVARVDAPKRPGLVNPKAESGRPQTVLIVDKIYKFPWEQKPSQITKAAPTPAPPKGAPSIVASTIGRPAAPATAPKPASGIGGSKPAVPAKAPTPAPAPSAISPELDMELAMVVAEIAGENGGAITKAQLGPKVFNKLGAGNANRQSLVKRSFEDSFLESGGMEGGQWSYDGATITLVGS